MPSVVIPYAGSCPHRAAALNWVVGRYREAGFEAPLISTWIGDEQFCKARLVNGGVNICRDDDVVVVADADVWTDGLLVAIAAVEDGAPWAVPHDQVHRLTARGSRSVVAGNDWRRQDLCQPAYQGMQGGGIVVARPEILSEVPMDPRFVGWGQEDQSWAMALHHLVGPAWRGVAPLIHLWHPEPPRLTRKRGSAANWDLFRRYCHARNTPGAMRELVDEAKDVAALPA